MGKKPKAAKKKACMYSEDTYCVLFKETVLMSYTVKARGLADAEKRFLKKDHPRWMKPLHGAEEVEHYGGEIVEIFEHRRG